jgi:hypothetical protein
MNSIEKCINENDIITANKEANVSDHACEEEEEPSSCLCFPFTFEKI